MLLLLLDIQFPFLFSDSLAALLLCVQKRVLVLSIVTDLQMAAATTTNAHFASGGAGNLLHVSPIASDDAWDQFEVLATIPAQTQNGLLKKAKPVGHSESHPKNARLPFPRVARDQIPEKGSCM